MTSDPWSRGPSLQQLNKQPPVGVHESWVHLQRIQLQEQKTRGRSGTYLHSARLRRVTVMENSLEQSTLSIVGVLPRWAVGVRTLVCARARVRDRTSAKPCMLISLWTTFWNQSSGFCHLCVFPNTHRKYQYVWMYMGCVCVLYLYEQCFFFLFVFAKGLSDGFYGSVGKKFKATTTWDRRCTWIQDTRRANLSIK